MTQSADSLSTPNGVASLTDRVKGLRLENRFDSPKGGRGGSGWLPWALCFLMAVTWASFGVRAYTTGGLKALFGSKSDEKASTDTAATEADKKDKLAFADFRRHVPNSNGLVFIDLGDVLEFDHGEALRRLTSVSEATKR